MTEEQIKALEDAPFSVQSEARQLAAEALKLAKQELKAAEDSKIASYDSARAVYYLHAAKLAEIANTAFTVTSVRAQLVELQSKVESMTRAEVNGK